MRFAVDRGVTTSLSTTRAVYSRLKSLEGGDSLPIILRREPVRRPARALGDARFALVE